jgi:TPR repeat protein
MAQAHRWYLEAAKAGDVGAQYLVASMFETGLGVEADERLARYWFEVAAKNGDVAARAKVKALQAATAAS